MGVGWRLVGEGGAGSRRRQTGDVDIVLHREGDAPQRPEPVTGAERACRGSARDVQGRRDLREHRALRRLVAGAAGRDLGEQPIHPLTEQCCLLCFGPRDDPIEFAAAIDDLAPADEVVVGG